MRDKFGPFILRAWRTGKDGKRIYARDYGKRAFKIYLTSGKSEK